MKKYFFYFATIAAIHTQAQQTYESSSSESGRLLPINISGQLANTVKFSRVVEGSPFFWDDFMPGILIAPDGSQFKNQQLKLNLVDNEMIYKDDKGNELVPSTPIASAIIDNIILQQKLQFDFYGQNSGKPNETWGWLQLLDSGKQCRMYKQTQKKMNETRPYGSATTEQHIMAETNYATLVNGVLKVPKKMEDIAPFFPGKEQSILGFISTNKLKTKQDKDWTKLSQFINSMP